MKIRKILLGLCAVLLVTGMSCPIGWVNAEGNTNDSTMVYTDDTFQTYYADGKTEFLLQETTLNVAVRDKATGNIWYSNPQDLTEEMAYGTTVMEQLQSQVILQYYDSSNQLLTMNSYKHCVKLSQYTIEKIQNGAQIRLVMGSVSGNTVLPQQIRARKFQEILAFYKEDSATVRRLKFFYTRISLDDYENDQERKKALSKYPLLDETDIYVLKSVNNSQRNELSDLFRAAGMTISDVKEEYAYLKYESQEEKQASFELTIRYEIKDGSLCVTVPLEEIRYDTDAYYLSKVTLLPYLGAGVNGIDGSLFMPDGCGTLIPFSPENGNSGRQYLKGKVYGRDISVDSDDANTNHFYAPVYGILEPEKAFLAILMQGEEGATITAEKGGFTHHYNTAYPEFVYLNQETMSADTQQTQSLILFEDAPTATAFSVQYRFFTGEQAQLGEMAAAYRTQLGLDDRPADTQELPLYVTVLGSINTTAQFLGIPYTKMVALTTLEQSGEILQDLHEAGVSRCMINLRGFTNGGLNSYAHSSFKLEGVVGSANQLEELVELADGLKATLFVEADFTRVIRTKWFDGFSSSRDTLRGLTKKISAFSQISMATGFEDTDSLTMSLNSRTALRYAKAWCGGAADYGLKNITFGDVGSTVGSDFCHRVSRAEAVEDYRELLELAQGQAGVTGGNVYSAAADCIIGLPYSDSALSGFGKATPFLQMVYAGTVNYTIDMVNGSEDLDFAVLKAIETGATLGFTVAKNNAYTLKDDVRQNKYCSVDYEAWNQRMKTSYFQVRDALHLVRGAHMTDHAYLTDEVTCTTYENGVRIYVNYGTVTYTEGAVRVDGCSYAVLS